MPIKMNNLLLLLSVVALAGCASQSARDELDFNQYVTSGNYEAGLVYSMERANPQDPDKADQQWLLQAASLNFILNNGPRSNTLFRKAETLGRAQDLQGALATTGNFARRIAVDEGAVEYQSAYYEDTMMNFYQAVNYWSSGAHADARVEFMRLDERQRRSAEYYAKRIVEQREALEEDEQASGVGAAERQLAASVRQWEPYEGYVNPAATYLDGLFFLKNGKSTSDYQRALSSFKRVYGLTENDRVLADKLLAEAALKGSRTELNQYVWVVFEQGTVARKQSKRIDVPLFTGTGVVYTGVSFPEMQPDNGKQPVLNVSNASGETSSTTPVGDMDRIAVADYKVELPSIVSRSIASAAVNALGQEVARQQFGMGGAITGAVYHQLSNNADIRTWSLLPKNFQVARMRHSGGAVSVSAPSSGETLTFDVRQDQPTIIYIKQTGAHAPLVAKTF